MGRTKWTDAVIEERIIENYRRTGKFPTCSYLKNTGQNDLACKIVSSGGFLSWANRLGMEREHSDSDTGWEGELEVEKLLKSLELNVHRPSEVKCPYDLLVNDVLRVDVKSARFASYGPCSGWFYRIGKAPQADLIALYQLDEKEVYWIPWNHVPQTSITISKTGGIYAPFRNNIHVLRSMLLVRESEVKWINKHVLKLNE